MKQLIRFRYVAAGVLFAAGWTLPLCAQGIVDQLPPEVSIQRAAGQSVQPFFEGWQRNPDGTVSMWFGYLNRNAEEEVDIPVGPDNRFDYGSADQGQPTHFLTHPRRHMFVFKIDLPKDWDKDKKLTWTLTSRGQTSTTHGWMQREWEVDNGVREENGNGLVRTAPNYDPPNLPPVITGSKDQAIALGQPLKLTASATDDGIPKPRKRPTVGPDGAPISSSAASRPQGMWIQWILYRAPVTGGHAAFSQQSTTPIYGQPVESTTDVTFTAPGTYWIQAIANDGGLETPYNVKVNVTGGTTAIRR